MFLSSKAWTKLAIPGIFLVSIVLIVSLLAGCSGATSSTQTTTSATSTLSQSATTPITATSNPSTTATASPSPTPTPRSSFNPKEVIMYSTTSTKDSGLMEVLKPLFEAKSGYKLTDIYVGSGAAMTAGQQGNADVLLVHAPDSELKFVADGWGINRKLVMHNDFLIVGPTTDPAGIKGMTAAVEALKKISTSNISFFSRGDNSGTDQLEKKLWGLAGITVKDKATTNPSWYIEGGTGTGMGALLGIAFNKQGYTITDRATYLANHGQAGLKIDLDIMVEGDPALLNVYHVIQINPAKFPGVINADGAKAFADFMINSDIQATIAKFGIDKYGQPLFYADATKTEADLGSK
jgi:tungstate transport system substrate-binding protein